MRIFSFFALTATLIFSACDSSGSNHGAQNPHRLNWQAVPAQFNPEVEETELQIGGIEKIDLDLFGFNNDVEIFYSKNISSDSGLLKIYRVYKKFASWGDLTPQTESKTLNLKNHGSYECSITIKNGHITQLEGGCYVRVQVLLPLGSEVEVYNVGKLISRRFIPIDAETFLANVKSATWAADKFGVIEEFLNSYKGMSKKPELSSEQLGLVIHGFMFSEEKFKALRRLHPVVPDRENLGTMIDREFTYFDREEAHRIVGI